MDVQMYDLGSGVEAFSTRRDSVLPYPVITGHQVHGTEVAIVDRPDLTREDLEGYDALVTALPGVAIGVRTADCVPILLYDERKRVVAAVHSGWKGTVQKISRRTLLVLEEQFGCRPEDMHAALGPCIGAESFQVGPEVVDRFREQGFPMDEIWRIKSGHPEIPMHDGHHLDLVRANTWLLEQCGVRPENISVAGIDTYRDVTFFSARREGIACGRTINAIRLIPNFPVY